MKLHVFQTYPDYIRNNRSSYFNDIIAVIKMSSNRYIICDQLVSVCAMNWELSHVRNALLFPEGGRVAGIRQSEVLSSFPKFLLIKIRLTIMANKFSSKQGRKVFSYNPKIFHNWPNRCNR